MARFKHLFMEMEACPKDCRTPGIHAHINVKKNLFFYLWAVGQIVRAYFRTWWKTWCKAQLNVVRGRA